MERGGPKKSNPNVRSKILRGGISGALIANCRF
jgi:hypothetical protein